MGFLDEIVEGAGRAASAAGDVIFSGHNDLRAKTQRSMEINRFASEQGFPLGAMDPKFAAQYPELAAEASDLAMSFVSGIGTGAVGAANRAAANAPGTLGAAAAAARRPQQPGLPGMGSSQGSMPSPPPPIPSGSNPNVASRTNPPSVQQPLPGFNGAPPPPPPMPGTPGTATSPPGPPPTGPIQGPAPLSPSPLGPPMPPAGPGFLQNIATWARNNPAAAAAAGLGALATGVAAGGAAAIGPNRSPSAAAAPEPERPLGPEMTPGADIGAEIGDKNAADAATRRRGNERNTMSPQQIAELGKAEAELAYANAQKAELERRMQNSDMTDSEKEAARQALETKLTQIREQGANTRSTAQIASEARNTDARIASDERNTDARITSDNRNTDVREAGANTRTGYEAQVTLRGQDQRGREAESQFISAMLANRIAEGKLSLDKADKVWEAYIKQAKLPSDILKSVSDAMAPMLPYMTNGKPGDLSPGLEAGGSMDALRSAAGVKGKSAPRRGYSAFDLTELASQYGGGPGQAQMPPRSVDDVFAGAGTVAQESIPNPNSAPLPRPDVPPMMSGMAPAQVAQPMDPEAEKRIFSSIR
jgi:hypothetical protein